MSHEVSVELAVFERIIVNNVVLCDNQLNNEQLKNDAEKNYISQILVSIKCPYKKSPQKLTCFTVLLCMFVVFCVGKRSSNSVLTFFV